MKRIAVRPRVYEWLIAVGVCITLGGNVCMMLFAITSPESLPPWVRVFFFLFGLYFACFNVPDMGNEWSKNQARPVPKGESDKPWHPTNPATPQTDRSTLVN